MSRTASGARAETLLRKVSSSSRTSGCTMASSCFMRSESSRTAAPSFVRSTTPSADGAGKRLLDQRRGAAAIERVHGGIGIVNRDAEPAEKIGGRRFAHADGAGEPEDEGHPVALDIGEDQRPQLRRDLGRHAEPALEARHRLMQQHAEPVDDPQIRAPRRRRRSGVFSGT